jgi:hypothetical protein
MEDELQKPLLTVRQFRERHSEIDRMLKAYKLTKRGKNLSNDALVALFDRSSLSLKATNAKSRTAVNKFADLQFNSLFASRNAPSVIHWITITSRAMSRPYQLAHTFNPRIARGAVARLFEGIDYLGMIDLAYFHNHEIDHAYPGKHAVIVGKAMSFHFHLLAWNCSESVVGTLKDEFNSFNSSLFEGHLAFESVAISLKTAAKKNVYMTKMPLKSYSAWPKRKKIVDVKTGEVVKEATGEWEIKKRPLRQGEAARIHNVLHRFTIPELMIGGGEGLAMKRSIIAKAELYLLFDYHAQVFKTKSMVAKPVSVGTEADHHHQNI